MNLREILSALAPETAARGFMRSLAGEVWAAEGGAVEAVLSELATVAPLMRGSFDAQADERPYAVRGRSAVLSMRGLMFPSGPAWVEKYGFVFSERMIERIRAAQGDDGIDDLILEVDSPGGSVLGTQALAEAVNGSRKPVCAHVMHMACSAAYFVASQADRIVARPGAMIGSIGTYAVVVDASRMAEDYGIKVHVVRAGDNKGVGTFGAPISEKQLQVIQERVDHMTDGFVAAVASGRDFTEKRAREFATGKTWDAAEALSLKLIDEIENMRSAAAPQTGVRGEPAKAAQQETPKMAMTEEEERKLRQELADARAQSAEKDTKLHQLGADLGKAKAKAEADQASAKGALIAEAMTSGSGDINGKVGPVNRAAVEKLAEHMNADELRTYFAGLPRIDRPTQIGHGGANDGKGGERATEMSAENKKVLSGLGVTMADIKAYGDVEAFGANGVMVKKDGTIVNTRAGKEE